MSEKERQKKDGQNKDKKNKAMRERENPNLQTASPKHQARDESNLTDTQPAPDDKIRTP
jgi:hypothetical protein